LDCITLDPIVKQRYMGKRALRFAAGCCGVWTDQNSHVERQINLDFKHPVNSFSNQI
jgi:hypothetical protein